ncbi:MAG TPA: hypothetical protein VG448_11615 [Solirubrobacterales bacterium]|nr:hypothetical protein [Solirubrobacterales bacterium]
MSEYEGPPLDIDLRVALGIVYDSPTEARRLRLLNALCEETVRLTGVLAWEEEDGHVRLILNVGALSAAVTIPFDDDTRCTISPDGTMKGVLPTGESWIVTPHWAEA